MTLALIQAAAPPAPATPASPATPAAKFAVPGAAGTVHHYTTSDIAALRARKEELSRQISSADSRRREVQRSLVGAVGADKAGLEQRLGVLDARIARLEQDIDENSSQLASLDATRVTTSSGTHWGPDTGNRIADNSMPLAIVLIMFVLSPIAFSISRGIWKRGGRPLPAATSPDTTQRLERIEQAVDAIAVEIERVSEGQRFVTRLMSEARPTPALGAAQPAMEPVPVGEERVAERR